MSRWRIAKAEVEQDWDGDRLVVDLVATDGEERLIRVAADDLARLDPEVNRLGPAAPGQTPAGSAGRGAPCLRSNA